MLKRFIKSAVSLIMLFSMIFSVSSLASAAGGPKVVVKLGGADLTVPAVVGSDARIYTPYDVFFKAIGAAASYEAKNGIVSAALGGSSVGFTVGADKMAVAVGKTTQNVSIDAKPYIDGGTVYIPIRYAAQALGYMVEWDGESNSVILQSVDDLIAQSGATYTVIDRYFSFQKTFNAQKHAVTGNFSLNINPSQDGKTTTPLTVNGTVSGLTDQNDAEMSLKMTSNASAFAKSLDSNNTLDPQTKLMLSLLDNLDMNMIVNSQTGMVYMKSPVISTMLGQKSDVWLSVDLGDMAGGSPVFALSNEAANASSFKDCLSAYFKAMCLTDATGISAMMIKASLLQVNKLVSDQAFVKTGDNYVSTFDTKASQGSVSIGETIKFTLSFNGSSYQGVSLDASVDIGGQGNMSMNCTSDATGSGSMKMTLDIPSVLTMDMSASFTSAATTQSPASQPPAGSTVLSANELLQSYTSPGSAKNAA